MKRVRTFAAFSIEISIFSRRDDIVSAVVRQTVIGEKNRFLIVRFSRDANIDTIYRAIDKTIATMYHFERSSFEFFSSLMTNTPDNNYCSPPVDPYTFERRRLCVV